MMGVNGDTSDMFVSMFLSKPVFPQRTEDIYTFPCPSAKTRVFYRLQEPGHGSLRTRYFSHDNVGP